MRQLNRSYRLKYEVFFTSLDYDYFPQRYPSTKNSSTVLTVDTLYTPLICIHAAQNQFPPHSFLLSAISAATWCS